MSYQGSSSITTRAWNETPNGSTYSEFLYELNKRRQRQIREIEHCIIVDSAMVLAMGQWYTVYEP